MPLTSKRQNNKNTVGLWTLTGKSHYCANGVKIDRSIFDVDAILVTHEHSDHIKGIGGSVSMGFQFMPRKTWQAMKPKDWESCLEQQEIFSIPETC